MRAGVGGKDVVVWRAENGEIAAWDNRCPHRGMALSHGFVRGNTLACLYHGWHYGSSGRCSYIPAHPELDPPATIHARQYSISEQGGVIWVSVDDDAEGTDLGLAPLRSFIVEAGEDVVIAACASTPLDGAVPVVLGNSRFQVAGDTLMALCNPIGRAGTQVTILTAPNLPVARRLTHSRWCEAMRRTAEQEAGK